MDLATQSTVELAKNYGMGFQSQLNSQIAEVEGLANGTNIQNLVLSIYKKSIFQHMVPPFLPANRRKHPLHPLSGFLFQFSFFGKTLRRTPRNKLLIKSYGQK